MDKRESYIAALQALLPTGQAWTREPSAILTSVLSIMASELARVDDRAADLLDEADPRTTLEMLGEWESVAGLPDLCTGEAATLQERRAALVERITRTGGQSKAYFIAVAQALGYEITIDEFMPFICGISQCGWPLNGGASVRHYWRVHVLGARLTYFRTGLARCGEKLLSIAAAVDLECILNRLKPAQSHLIFSYEGV